MELKIVWTKRAKNNYAKILSYIVNEFGSSSGGNYHLQVEKLISLLQSFPELRTRQPKLDNLYGLFSTDERQFSTLLTKKNIKIINVIDNRWKKKEQ